MVTANCAATSASRDDGPLIFRNQAPDQSPKQDPRFVIHVFLTSLLLLASHHDA